ncbi:hypothetical protein, partial [Erythrobacter sp. QSSC1-22B]|uniref:hypothetical protein n=1 Tax=Erythrobacter sp. QSSC1-22B TaxID=1860125 RepID=UPI001F413E8A
MLGSAFHQMQTSTIFRVVIAALAILGPLGSGTENAELGGGPTHKLAPKLSLNGFGSGGDQTTTQDAAESYLF